MSNSLVLLDMGGRMGPMGGHMGMGPLMMLPGLVFGLLVLFVVVKLLKSGRVGPVRWDPRGADAPGPSHGGPGHGPWGRPSPEEAALATLADRLAKGEISPEEYLERSTALRGGRKEG